MRAASAGRLAIVRLLIDHRVPIDARSRDGPNAVMATAFGGHADVLTTLLDAGADTSATDRQGRTVLMAAALSGSARAVDVMLKAGAGVDVPDAAQTARNYSFANGSLEIADRLLRAGARKGRDAALGGRTALIGAAASGDLPLVEMLLKRGADVEAADEGGGTAWTHAYKNGHKAILKVLETAAGKK